MSPKFRFLISALTIAAAAAFALMPGSSIAGTAAEIDSDVDKALASLYGQMPEAKELGKTSKAILVFPKIIKGGLILVGGQGGEGALRVNGKTRKGIELDRDRARKGMVQPLASLQPDRSLV